jgi:hypothetical protein
VLKSRDKYDELRSLRRTIEKSELLPSILTATCRKIHWNVYHISLSTSPYLDQTVNLTLAFEQIHLVLTFEQTAACSPVGRCLRIPVHAKISQTSSEQDKRFVATKRSQNVAVRSCDVRAADLSTNILKIRQLDHVRSSLAKQHEQRESNERARLDGPVRKVRA